MNELLKKWRERLADQETVTQHGEAYHRALRHCIEDLELEIERRKLEPIKSEPFYMSPNYPDE